MVSEICDSSFDKNSSVFTSYRTNELTGILQQSSVVNRKGGENAVEIALTNQLVLKQIFSYLELMDLKECRLVKKFWNSEAASYIPEFRKCQVSIACNNSNDPCSGLKALNQFVSNLPSVSIINSLKITLGHHINCEYQRSDSKSNDELLQNPSTEAPQLSSLELCFVKALVASIL